MFNIDKDNATPTPKKIHIESILFIGSVPEFVLKFSFYQFLETNLALPVREKHETIITSMSAKIKIHLMSACSPYSIQLFPYTRTVEKE